MYQFSDSDTPDSDEGRRFKTESTRNKIQAAARHCARRKSPSPHRRRRERGIRSRSRSKSRTRRKHRSKSRSPRQTRRRSKSLRKHRSRSRSAKEDRRKRNKERSTKSDEHLKKVKHERIEVSGNSKDGDRRKGSSRHKGKDDAELKRTKSKDNGLYPSKDEECDSSKLYRRDNTRYHSSRNEKNESEHSDDEEILSKPKHIEPYSKMLPKSNEENIPRMRESGEDTFNEVISNKGEDFKFSSEEFEEVSTEETADSYGPALPPTLSKLKKKKLSNGELKFEDQVVNPTLPIYLQKIKPENETVPNTDQVYSLEIKESCQSNLPTHFQRENELEVKSVKESREPTNIETLSQVKEETNDSIIGPALPPHLRGKLVKIEKESIAPPILSSSFKNATLSVQENTEGFFIETDSVELRKNEEESCIGPTLPPIFQGNITENKSIGPTLPQHLREQLAKAAEETISTNTDHEEEEDVYGPLPPEMAKNSKSHIALEERALQIKINSLEDSDADIEKREEWMLELPAVRSASLGLGPKQFRANPTPDMSDRSSWTDTPEDKLKKKSGKKEDKVDLKKESELMELHKRDKEQEKMIQKHKREDKSLLEVHQSKIKEQAKEGETVRRPFSRDIDLKVNRFDEAQKKAILKKAQLLDDRFSRGQSKFL